MTPRPTWIYRYTRVINPRTGRVGTRYDLQGWKGPEPYLPFDCSRLKRSGTIMIYVNDWAGPPDKNGRRPSKGLFPGDEEGYKVRYGQKSISGLFEPILGIPIRGHGNTNGKKDAILTERDDGAGTLAVYVFPNQGGTEETLYYIWLDGGVSLEPETHPSPLMSNITTVSSHQIP